jgi:hypothetical protein
MVVSKAKCMILNGSDDFYDLYGDSKTREIHDYTSLWEWLKPHG